MTGFPPKRICREANAAVLGLTHDAYRNAFDRAFIAIPNQSVEKDL